MNFVSPPLRDIYFITCLSVCVGVSLSIMSYRCCTSPLISSKAAQTAPRTGGGISLCASLIIASRVSGKIYTRLY